jgi:signal transduction histidine kinase
MPLKKIRYFLFLLVPFYSAVYGQQNIQELYNYSSEAFKNGKYDEALNANFKALKIAEKNKNCPQTAYAILQIGKMHYYTRDKKLAMSFFYKSLRIIDSCHVDSLRHVAYHNIGSIYTELGKIDSALFFLGKSKELLEHTHDYASLSKVNAVIAEIYLQTTLDFKKAEGYINKAEEYAKLSGDRTWIAFAIMKRGILHQLRKDDQKAIVAFKEALKQYEKSGPLEGRLYALRYMLVSMSLSGHPETNDYMGKYIDLKDSVYRAEGAAKIAEYKTLYETEKKESENKLLQQQNLLNQIEISAKNKAIISLLVGVLLIVIILLWRLSVINLKKKNRELEATKAIQKEKERISRDLHDNVGGQLSYVLFSLDGIQDEDKRNRVELTTNINESIRNVIGNLRETIWAINDEFVTVNDLSDKLKVYARTMFRNRETKITFNEEFKENLSLKSLVGLNLYRICQEAINNAFKHSKATELKIDIMMNEKITIKIKDNGIGFEQNNKNSEGFGLSNIRSRASEAGILLELNAGVSKGVEYILIV